MLGENFTDLNFRAQFESLAAHEKTKDLLINDTLKTLERYVQEVKTLTFELEDAKKSRRWYQEEVEQLKIQAGDSQKIVTSRNNFVVVLVDGDGALFLDELLEKPREGANEAARRLSHNVKISLRDSGVDTDKVTVIVRIFANLNDLAKTLCLTNVITARSDLNTFAEQFTVSRGEFDFINVGPDMLDHYHNNFQCKRIFFAGCHDNGYVNELQKYTSDPDRIVLIETTPAQPTFKDLLPFAITRFDNIFRSTSLTGEEVYPTPTSGGNSPTRPTPVRPVLTSYTPSPPRPTPVQPVILNSSNSPRQTPTKSTLIQKAPSQEPPKPSTPITTQIQTPAYTSIQHNLPLQQPQPQPHPSQWSNIISSGNGGVSVRYPQAPAQATPQSYASAGGLGSHQNISIKTDKARTIEYNATGLRLDTPNKKPTDQSAFDTYFIKLSKVKNGDCRGFCNYKYLQGKCKRDSSCPMEHEVVLSEREIAVHRYRARLGQCTNGPTCCDWTCCFSHHCPYVPNCTSSDLLKLYDLLAGLSVWL
ncbi:hypothetical protein N7456_007641 [Penicillium angulare]|uniref:C3H1-type domain-containing protein n=1 Tax=Penicillium angulare TaxID=116970 RepID=A0A9W9FB22_9EURO|nr:hypothetical protein N7456_007641 [Penicillium angulare]